MDFARTSAHRAVRGGRSRYFLQTGLSEISTLSAIESTHAHIVLVVGSTANSRGDAGTT